MDYDDIELDSATVKKREHGGTQSAGCISLVTKLGAITFGFHSPLKVRHAAVLSMVFTPTLPGHLKRFHEVNPGGR